MERCYTGGTKPFNIGQGLAQGCSMSPIIFINQLLDEVEKAGIGITVNLRLGV